MKPESNKCTNGMISAPMVCSGPVHQCWCTDAGGKVEEKKAGGNKALQPIASSVFYIFTLNKVLMNLNCCK